MRWIHLSLVFFLDRFYQPDKQKALRYLQNVNLQPCFADTVYLTDWHLYVSNLPTQVCITRHGQVQPEGQWPWGQRGGGQWLWHGAGIPRGQAAAGGGLFWPDTPRNAPSAPPRWAFGDAIMFMFFFPPLTRFLFLRRLVKLAPLSWVT